MLNNLLFYRFGIFNALMFAFFVAAWIFGVARDSFVLDTSFITYAIALLFLIAFGSTFIQIWKVSQEKNLLKKFEAEGWTATEWVEVFKRLMKRLVKIAHIESCANWMVTLGLLGTVYGFLIALSGVNVEQAANVTGVQKLVVNLINGAHVALYTTLVGGFFGLWTEVNYRMLKTAIEVEKE